MDDERYLLESILTAQIVLLAEDMRRRDKAGGRKHVGTDYIQEAAEAVRREQPKVLRALGLPPEAGRREALISVGANGSAGRTRISRGKRARRTAGGTPHDDTLGPPAPKPPEPGSPEPPDEDKR